MEPVPAARSYQTSAGPRTCFLHLVSVPCSCAGVSGVRWPARASAIQPDPPLARPEGGGRGVVWRGSPRGPVSTPSSAPCLTLDVAFPTLFSLELV